MSPQNINLWLYFHTIYLVDKQRRIHNLEHFFNVQNNINKFKHSYKLQIRSDPSLENYIYSAGINSLMGGGGDPASSRLMHSLVIAGTEKPERSAECSRHVFEKRHTEMLRDSPSVREQNLLEPPATGAAPCWRRFAIA